MRGFEPIAIVGRACVLPGASSPDELFHLVTSGADALSSADEARWGVEKARVVPSLIASDRGGYVTRFAPDSRASRVAGDIPDLDRLDPSVRWLLSCAKTAIAEAGLTAAPARSALILGNLSYPSEAMTRFVEDYWLSRAHRSNSRENRQDDPRNRFCSGLPVHLVARALGIEGSAFALDAACASSLYAIKLACDRLHDGDADFALAGGMARADDLFIHLGFTALQALSPSGQSRPFHAQADGLVPGEGAALVALMRLDDAIAAGCRIYGVIRAVGLSNDGRQNGFLAPAASGQVAAMRTAYEQSSLSPSDIGYVECHATGTARGDAIELESLAEVWGGAAKPAIGSLKSNIGHTITASGAASLLKMLGAFEASVLPPSVCTAPAETVAAAGFFLPTLPVAWEANAPRRAAISNFGFGGNNAHMIVEEWVPGAPRRSAQPNRLRSDERIAVVSMGVIAGAARGAEAFASSLLGPANLRARTDEIALPLEGLAFPPNDLKASLAQQTAILEVVDEALNTAPALPPDRTGVLIGMGTDTTVARHGLRLKIAHLLGRSEDDPEVAAWRAANETSAPRLTAAGVLGTMPNIPANRVHAAKNFTGWGFTVASEELSGLAALKIAARALRVGDLDAVLVGASDFSSDPAHEAAMRALAPRNGAAGDAAVVLVLMRESDADAKGADILATLDTALALDGEGNGAAVRARFGHAHAASGLLEVAAEIVEARSRARVDASGAWPALGEGGKRTVRVRSFSGREAAVAIEARADPLASGFSIPHAVAYAGANKADLLSRLARRDASRDGVVRLALVADDQASLDRLRDAARAALEAGRIPAGPGIHYSETAIGGEVAFCFTGAAAVYPNAAHEFFLAFPEIGDAIADRFAGTRELARTLHGAGVSTFTPTTQLTACALVCQAHAEFTRGMLGLKPQAAIGLSSGETNALLAFGVWRDLDRMLAEIDASGLYDPELTGECLAARAYWNVPAEEKVDWRCWRIAAPVAQVEAALAGEPRCYLTIVHGPEDCVIGGDAQACERVLAKVGKRRALPLGLDMIVHCPVLLPFADTWRRIHTRETHAAPGVRFYTNDGNRAYVPTREAAAEAITRQALETIDFPRTIERAYADGVRVFIEHGPRGILTSAIARVLAGRPHLAVALDRREKFGLKGLVSSVLQLWTASVDIQIAPVLERLKSLAPKERPECRLLRLPAHLPDIVFPLCQVPSEIAPNVAAQRMLPPENVQIYDFASTLARQSAPAAAPRRRVDVRQTAQMSVREGAVVRLFEDVASAHREYLVRQKSLHEQFLRTRAGSFVVPLRSGGTMPVDPVAASRQGGSGVPHGAESAPTLHREHEAEEPLAVPRLTRAQLMIHASGHISEIFGSEFARQDGYARQVRMPEPPLLLADRAMLFEGVPGSMGKGRTVTETDVQEGAWYVHQGRMSPGTVIEAGQADLLLISWLGADFLNKGERVYRLLGCELTFFGGLPQPGETLRYDIHIDGHAKTGDVRLFFFHYDCHIDDRLLLRVRDGQAGFFSDAELATSGGVLWDAAEDLPKEDARLDAPPCLTAKRAFPRVDVDAWRDGNAYTCFGSGFERAAAHQRTPTIPSGRLALIEDIAEFDPAGGPWGRGYLRARAHVPADAWFYDGHFKNDPCMPGTLMADAATQALSFAMAAMGFTIERDGWRFEPVPDEPAKFVCRGQVVPDAPHELDYEVFIEDVIDGDTPTVFAALLCKSDGFKVFGCRRFGLRLVPDWPLTTRRDLLACLPAPRIVGTSGEVRGDEAALMACAWGRPSDAFGTMYQKFDGAARAPRLPGPPYHFLTRVLSVDGAPGAPALGASVVTEYDVSADAWYFAENRGQMPLSVLIEVLLQPCGWLASFLGFAANRANDVLFRNLDGDNVVLHRSVVPSVGKLTVKARLERFAQAAGSTIVFFTVSCEDGGGLIMTMKTDFGFFDPQALAAQVGLPVPDSARARLAEPSAHGASDLTRALAPLAGQTRLKMLDEITGYWPGDGQRLPRIRARQSVDPGAWYFKAHFYQDPVQPGSLGLEALTELAQCLLVFERPEIAGAAFELIALGELMAWRFRGQVTPLSREVVTEIEALEMVEETSGILLRARGNLWVDGLRIYEIPSFAVRARRHP